MCHDSLCYCLFFNPLWPFPVPALIFLCQLILSILAGNKYGRFGDLVGFCSKISQIKQPLKFLPLNYLYITVQLYNCK